MAAHHVRKMLVNKHAETIEYVKSWPTFQKKLQTSRINDWRLLTIKNFQVIVLIWTQTYALMDKIFVDDFMF